LWDNVERDLGALDQRGEASLLDRRDMDKNVVGATVRLDETVTLLPVEGILAEWRTWVGHQQSAVSHTTAEALAFFKEIEQNKPELLSFDSADKWEFVKSWLLNAGLIKEP
jgi:hypothetical protein